MQSYTYSTVCVCLFDATKNREKKLATICSVITCVAVVRAWEISCPQKPPNCRYSIYTVEIYHIFAFESFGRQTASAASSGIKALHKYERQLLGYRGTSAFVRVFLSVAVQIVCLCECVLVNGCSNSLSWGSLSGAVKWQERELSEYGRHSCCSLNKNSLANLCRLQWVITLLCDGGETQKILVLSRKTLCVVYQEKC